MILKQIILSIQRLFQRRNEDKWISSGLDQLEKHRESFDTVPFTLVELKKEGFQAKVNGLYAYIHFSHMPWKYPTADVWKAVAPSLIGKRFFGKIHQIERSTNYVLLNGEIAQFKTAALTREHDYQGLIVGKSRFGLSIDIGYHFGWKYGSIIGFLPQSKFAEYQQTRDFWLGQEITTMYLEPNLQGQPVFSNQREAREWETQRPQQLVGQIRWAKVIRDPVIKTASFFIDGKFKTRLLFANQADAPRYQKPIQDALKALRHGQIIHCEIVGCDETNRTLLANWLIEIDTQIIVDNSLINHLDGNTIAKLTTLKQQIDAKNKYLPDPANAAGIGVCGFDRLRADF